MENVPTPSPKKQSQRTPHAKSGGVPRGSAGGAKQPPKQPKKPVQARRPASQVEPSDAAAPSPAAVVEAEPQTKTDSTAETRTDAATGRPAVAWLSVPKLSLPKLSLGRDKAAPAEPSAPVAVEPRAAEPKVEPRVAPKKTAVRRKPRKRGSQTETILKVEGLTKRFDDKIAVNDVDLEVVAGSFYGIVGPNGAGKTTTLSMITGLLRPTAGTVTVHGANVWSDPVVAKRNMGVLPDRLRLFDRLTGAQLLYYAGVLRGMDGATVRARAADLAHVFGLEESLPRLVSDYSAGMTKKVALAAAMIHSPRMLVLDEPFESVDPVSAATVTEILKAYVVGGGTVLLSSHSMDLVQRICDFVAVVVDGSVLADGTMESVRNGGSLEERFIELAGGHDAVEGLAWLSSFSD